MSDGEGLWSSNRNAVWNSAASATDAQIAKRNNLVSFMVYNPAQRYALRVWPSRIHFGPPLTATTAAGRRS